MSKRILIRHNSRIVNLLLQDGKIIECAAFPEQESHLVLGGIYIAVVSQVIERLAAAFLKVGSQTLYYSLKENPQPIITKQGRSSVLKSGDELMIQVKREPIGTKDALGGCDIEIGGRYVVLIRTPGRQSISFSRKITDTAWKSRVREELAGLAETLSGMSVLVRTNAKTVPFEDILREATSLCTRYERLLEQAKFRPAGSCLYRPEPDYIRLIRDTPADQLEEVLSDDRDLLAEARNSLLTDPAMQNIPFRLYDDASLSLVHCYNIEAALTTALNRVIWLPCGGYITIEQTEAFTAVDVNSGKAVRGFADQLEESFLAVNLEAARVLMAQLRLRNISGMILADFINMKKKENEEKLLRLLNELAAQDPTKTVVVDIIKLGLVEITRKKTRDTLDKQLRS